MPVIVMTKTKKELYEELRCVLAQGNDFVKHELYERENSKEMGKAEWKSCLKIGEMGMGRWVSQVGRSNGVAMTR